MILNNVSSEKRQWHFSFILSAMTLSCSKSMVDSFVCVAVSRLRDICSISWTISPFNLSVQDCFGIVL